MCRACNAMGPKLLKCSRCKGVYYCSVECQKVDWKDHKTLCATHDPIDSDIFKKVLEYVMSNISFVTFLVAYAYKFVDPTKGEFLQSDFRKDGDRYRHVIGVYKADDDVKNDLIPGNIAFSVRYYFDGMYGKTRDSVINFVYEKCKDTYNLTPHHEIFDTLQPPLIILTDADKYEILSCGPLKT